MTAHAETVTREGQNKVLIRLIEEAQAMGYQVRREKLKQGPGWKSVSGVCRLRGQPFIFVDSKNPLPEQISFLSSVLQMMKQETAVA